MYYNVQTVVQGKLAVVEHVSENHYPIQREKAL